MMPLSSPFPFTLKMHTWFGLRSDLPPPNVKGTNEVRSLLFFSALAPGTMTGTPKDSHMF